MPTVAERDEQNSDRDSPGSLLPSSTDTDSYIVTTTMYTGLLTATNCFLNIFKLDKYVEKKDSENTK